MKLRVLAFALAILAFFIFVGSPFEQAAEALVGIDDALIAVIIAALAGVGIAFSSTGGYQGVKSYVESLMTEYADSQSTTPEALIRGSRAGSNNLGQIIVNNRFLTFIDTFALWLKSKFSLVDNSEVTAVEGGATMSGCQVYLVPFGKHDTGLSAGKHDEYLVTGTGSIYCIFTDSNIQIYFSIGEGAITITRHYNFTGQNNTVTGQLLLTKGQWTINAQTMTNTNIYTAVDRTVSADSAPRWVWSFGGPPVVYSMQQAVAALNAGVLASSDGQYIETGVINPPSDDTDYVPGDGGVIDVDADWGTPFDIIVGQVIPDAVIDGTIGDTVITYDGEDSVQDQVTDVGGTTISSNPGDYQVSGIASVFPFCIPFDVYNFLTVLDAEPEAPHFQWRFYVPGIYDGTIDIDLSPFNGVAQVLRTAELLLFIVGLAVVTRNRFIRS